MAKALSFGRTRIGDATGVLSLRGVILGVLFRLRGFRTLQEHVPGTALAPCQNSERLVNRLRATVV